MRKARDVSTAICATTRPRRSAATLRRGSSCLHVWPAAPVGQTLTHAQTQTRGKWHQQCLPGFAHIAVALFFGLQAASYQVGTLSSAGAGLFALRVSSRVGLLAVMPLLQARIEAVLPRCFNVKPIGVIMLILIGFVQIARTLTILLAIAFAFQQFLSLSLSLRLLGA